MRGVLDKIFMIIGATFFLGIIIPKFRIGLAEAVSPILDPLLVLPIHVVIFILAIFTALYSTLIQKYTVDFARLKEIQKRIVEFQRKYVKAMKEGNQYLLKQLEKQRREISDLQMELMMTNIRTMFYTVAVTIPIWVWLWYKIYNVQPSGAHSAVSKFTLVVPFSGLIHVSDPVIIIPWWLFWYFICSILIGQIFRRVVGLV